MLTLFFEAFYFVSDICLRLVQINELLQIRLNYYLIDPIGLNELTEIQLKTKAKIRKAFQQYELSFYFLRDFQKGFFNHKTQKLIQNYHESNFQTEISIIRVFIYYNFNKYLNDLIELIMGLFNKLG